MPSRMSACHDCGIWDMPEPLMSGAAMHMLSPHHVLCQTMRGSESKVWIVRCVTAVLPNIVACNPHLLT
jgi:hypothetical protein